MAGYIKIIFVASLIAACTAEPQRFRNSRFNRFSARQEESPSTQSKAPYPAAGFKPDVPFELPTETTTATVPTEASTVQLDSTYGPPTTYSPTTYETPTTETILLEDEDDDTESVISVAVSYDNADASEEPQRLVFGQRIRPMNDAKKGPQKLRLALAEPIYLEDGSFVYSAPL